MQTFAQKENAASLSTQEFDKLSSFIYDQCGIKMPPIKKTMLETRLRKRLRATGHNTFGEYCNFLFSKQGTLEELIHMIDVVTTNKTDFFREPAQFTFLTNTALPELVQMSGAGKSRPLHIWSAGCSTGEEPYTIAIVLSEFARQFSQFQFSVLATDISTRVLDTAKTAIYENEKVGIIPMELKKKYFLKGKNHRKNFVRVVPDLRKRIGFQRINFMEGNLNVTDKMDIVFCRNVIIYFDKETQERVIKKLLDQLVPGGYLFVGHSETIFNSNFPIRQVAPSIYRKLDKI